MPQPKDIEWLNGYKNKTQIYAVFKRSTSLLGTHTNWKWEDGRKVHANRNQKKAGVKRACGARGISESFALLEAGRTDGDLGLAFSGDQITWSVTGFRRKPVCELLNGHTPMGRSLLPTEYMTWVLHPRDVCVSADTTYMISIWISLCIFSFDISFKKKVIMIGSRRQDEIMPSYTIFMERNNLKHLLAREFWFPRTRAQLNVTEQKENENIFSFLFLIPKGVLCPYHVW